MFFFLPTLTVFAAAGGYTHFKKKFPYNATCGYGPQPSKKDFFFLVGGGGLDNQIFFFH